MQEKSAPVRTPTKILQPQSMAKPVALPSWHTPDRESTDSGLCDESAQSTPKEGSVCSVATPTKQVEPTSSKSEQEDADEKEKNLVHDLLVRQYAPAIVRIKCLCGAAICRGWLF